MKRYKLLCLLPVFLLFMSCNGNDPYVPKETEIPDIVDKPDIVDEPNDPDNPDDPDPVVQGLKIIDNPDGPYVLYANNKIRIIGADKDGCAIDRNYDKLAENFLLDIVTHNKKHQFKVKLHEKIERQNWKQNRAEKVLAISDPHGNFDCFFSVLESNGVINEKYEWTFGKNQLLINGDIFDRGDDVLPIFWLVYKLDYEARKAGGAVFFLIGNHESMVLRNDLRYINDKYVKIANHFDKKDKYGDLFGADTELGRWIANGNTIQIIGDDLYVHAGLSARFYKEKYDPAYVNTVISKNIFKDKAGREAEPDSKFFFSSSSGTVDGPGPIWYRGMVGYESHVALKEDMLDEMLKHYNVKRIIVGHTVMSDVRTFYKGKVIAINVDNQKNYNNKNGRGILIENGKTYVINDYGDKKILN